MNVSLLGGWFPWTVQAAALALFVTAIGWRDRTWRVKWGPIALGTGLLITAFVAVAVLTLSGITDPIPTDVWLWSGIAIAALCVLGFGWRSAQWWRRSLVAPTAVLALFCGANSVNIDTGYYPTLDDAIGGLTDQPLPAQISLAELDSLHGKTTTGRIVKVDIPATPSGFAHRQELVYLPPAWFRSQTRPQLPVLEMIGGEFAVPDNWLRAGDALKTADDYAAEHNGFAPILVFVDATGGFKVDTECVDGKHGNAETHLVKDIPPFVQKTFNASTDPHKWGVAGWSMGGTCAFDLVIGHPDVFMHFGDFSGDKGPYVGNKDHTVQELYGGDEAAWAAHEPANVLAANHGKYQGVSGYFGLGDQEKGQIDAAKNLDAAAKKAGVTTTTVIGPGKHSWQTGAVTFTKALPWLAQQLGVPGAHS
ncbi:alpha/beta hydrolase-fold protein [Kitasatospora sp. NPDC097643]|uniref:alpha/beta hydrolase n=1 Tax=Kitasatospora sp. NPDC097643 TaxID=3157230 RepID=UPI00332696D7